MRVPELAVCRYLVHVLQALEYVHLKGVLHLDVKCVCIAASSWCCATPPCLGPLQA